MRQPHLSLILFLVMPFTLMAQDDAIATDRPDQTETVSIVPAGKFQLETGFNHRQVNRNSYALTVPTTLWKFGITKSAEVRVETEYSHDRYNDSLVSGLQPVTVGFKISLWEEKGIMPEASLITALSLPKVAGKQLTATYPAPHIKLLFENTISPSLAIGYNFDADWDGETSEPAFEYTISPNFDITEKLKGYAEAYAILYTHHRLDHWIDAGLMYLITKDIQIDIAAGYQLTPHSNYHQYFETVGLSFRI